MRAIEKIAERFADVSRQTHGARNRLVWDLVASLVTGGRATVTSLGRHLKRAIDEKHGIKCADRALSNRHMFEERHHWYRSIAEKAVRGCRRPVIVIDGTPLDAGWGALRASLVMSGRAVTILDEVHRESALNHPKVHASFLEALRKLLPQGCRPILVVDGGFMGPFFEKVRKLGWDYVGRLGRAMWVHPDGGSSAQVRDLFRIARRKPRDFGRCAVTRERYRARVVLFDGRSRRARRPPTSLPRGQNRQRKRRMKAREPWVLVTSCLDLSAHDIVALYQHRMQIEESFRDDKSPRFGRGFKLARCRSAPRLAVMLLLLALASFVELTVGLIGEARGLARRFQANSTRTRRVLSLAFLARRLLARTDFLPVGRDIDCAFSRFSAACAAPHA
jgi:hypothetical protein